MHIPDVTMATETKTTPFADKTVKTTTIRIVCSLPFYSVINEGRQTNGRD